MKQLTVIMILTLVLSAQNVVQVNRNNTIHVFNDVAEGMDLNIVAWQDVFIRDISQKEYNQMRALLKKDYTSEVVSHAQMQKIVYTPIVANDSSMYYEIHVLIPKQYSNKIKMQFIFSGNDWNEEMDNTYATMTKKLQKHFKMLSGANFSCATLDGNGIINDGKLIYDLLENLNTLRVKHTEDNVAGSTYKEYIYGYSARFHQSIDILDEPINFQLAVREKTDQKKQLIIGTPIILDEY